jgi:predicted dehydrogenase
MDKLRAGIVGLGWVAGEYAKSFLHNPATELAAVCSRRPLGPGDIEAQYGTPAEVYNDFESMLRKARLDLVALCTPHRFHAEQTIAAARAGVNVIIEKPVALSWEDAKRMLAIVRASKVRTLVSFEVRFLPLMLILRRLIDEGELGELHYGEVDYFHGIGPWAKQYAWNIKREMAGSSLLTAGCHALDALLWLMGQAVQEVFSYATRSAHPDYAPYEYPTTSVTLLKFRNGAVGKCASCIDALQPYQFPVHLVGSKGSVLNNQLYSERLKGQTGWATIPTILPDSGDVTHHPFQPEIDHFVDCLLAGKEASPNLEEALRSHEVIFAADRSAETGKPVSLPLSPP